MNAQQNPAVHQRRPAGIKMSGHAGADQSGSGRAASITAAAHPGHRIAHGHPSLAIPHNLFHLVLPLS